MYAFTYDVPVDEHFYQRVKAEIGEEYPKGLVVHLVAKQPDGLRHFDVWESREDWERFRDERVDPAVDKLLAQAGFRERPPNPPPLELELVDVWLGD